MNENSALSAFQSARLLFSCHCMCAYIRYVDIYTHLLQWCRGGKRQREREREIIWTGIKHTVERGNNMLTLLLVRSLSTQRSSEIKSSVYMHIERKTPSSPSISVEQGPLNSLLIVCVCVCDLNRWEKDIEWEIDSGTNKMLNTTLILYTKVRMLKSLCGRERERARGRGLVRSKIGNYICQQHHLKIWEKLFHLCRRRRLAIIINPFCEMHFMLFFFPRLAFAQKRM